MRMPQWESAILPIVKGRAGTVIIAAWPEAHGHLQIFTYFSGTMFRTHRHEGLASSPSLEATPVNRLQAEAAPAIGQNLPSINPAVAAAAVLAG